MTCYRTRAGTSSIGIMEGRGMRNRVVMGIVGREVVVRGMMMVLIRMG